MNNQRTDSAWFGFKQVVESEKDKLVNQVFSSVVNEYDLMNDSMSFGLHRVWKRIAVAHASIRTNSKVLDVACGTGDLSLAIAKKIGPKGSLVMTDINAEMLKKGRARMINKGHVSEVQYVLSDAENLAFEHNSFDRIVISFGLRNVTRIKDALQSMYKTLSPGGKLVILEFSKPVIPLLEKLYDRYSFNVIPTLGELIARDRTSYQYLVESIRQHPDQETLADTMAQVGFDRVEYFNLMGGIVALHTGRKI